MDFIRSTITLAAAGCLTAGLCGCEDASTAKNGDADSGGAANGSVPTGEDVAREAEQAAVAAGEFTQAKVDEYKQDLRENLASVRNRIGSLGERIAELPSDARSQGEQTLDDLRSRREQLEMRLGQASADTAEAWGEVRTGLENAWSDLQKAVQQAAEKYGSDAPDSGGESDDDP